jgi:hypothetical protein
MKLKKLTTILLVIFMIAALALVISSCAPEQTGEDKKTQDSNTVIPGLSLDKTEVFNKISTGATALNQHLTSDRKTEQITYVNSQFNVEVKDINLDISYQANYNNERRQDSEIYLKIFDHFNHQDKISVYYANSTLYYRIGKQFNRIEGFGGTSMFNVFFDVMKNFDLGELITSEAVLETLNMVRFYTLTENISKANVANNIESFNIINVPLDTSKDVVNDGIQNSLVPFGAKFDPLTDLLLGVKLSSLSAFKVERFTLRRFNATVETLPDHSTYVHAMEIVFDDDEEGMEPWGTVNNDYRVEIKYAIDTERQQILTQEDRNNLNSYVESKQGQFHFKGYLEIPDLDERFPTDLQLILDMANNTNNKILLDIRDKSDNLGESHSINEQMIASYYKDGNLYIDSSGFLNRYVKRAVDYEAVSADKIKITTLDVSSMLQNAIGQATALLTKGFSISSLLGSTGAEPDAGGILLSKVRSEGDRVILRVDDELVTGLSSNSSATLVSQLSELLGITRGQAELLYALGIFDDLYLEFSYNTNKHALSPTPGEFMLQAISKDRVLCTLALVSEDIPVEGLDILFPDEVNPSYFQEYEQLVTPDIVNVEIDALISTENASTSQNADLSKLMGIFMGDVSGKNTPLRISPGTDNGVKIQGHIATYNDDTYVTLTVSKGTEILVRVNTDMDAPEDVLVDNRMIGAKYRMRVSVIKEGLNKLSAEGSVFDFNNLVTNVPLILEESVVRLDGESICIEMFPHIQKGKTVDPLKKITGVPGLMSTARVKVTFALPDIEEPTDGYYSPVININNEEIWSGMYEAKFQEKAEVVFGNNVKEYFLTFTGESVKMVTGKTNYNPTTSLFGLQVAYSMYFTDRVNGTNKVLNLKDAFMIIDPGAVQPMADTIEVIYDNGRIGSLPYRIEGFPYNNTNIKQVYSGLPAQTYSIIIGEGSIGETRFDALVEVLNCVPVVPEGDYYNNTIPIVAKVTIDPYDYAIKKAEAEARGEIYNPIVYRQEGENDLAADTLELTFYSNNREAPDVYRKEYLENFDWGFDPSLISFRGGLFVITANYGGLEIGLEVTVLTKIVSHIQINDEESGHYTIDALDEITYTLPLTTVLPSEATAERPANEVRVYFEGGHFRVIGNLPSDFTVSENEMTKFDGTFPGILNWNHKVANNVAIDKAINPLNDGRDNKARATFGDDCVGYQNVEITVVCPKRIVGTQADSLLAITKITYGGDGEIIHDVTERQAVKVSNASFFQDKPIGSYFELDPYSEVGNRRLPSKIWIEVMYRNRIQTLGYDVTWLTSLDDTPDNIIDAEGNILNVYAQEEFFVVYGKIGGDENFQIVTMIIHNKSGEYESVEMLDENSLPFKIVETEVDAEGTVVNTTVIEVVEEVEEDGTVSYNLKRLNPYQPLDLPTYFKLKFSEASGIAETQYMAHWKYKDADGQEHDAKTYIYPYTGGNFTIYTKLSADTSSGMLDQIITLNLHFDKKEVVPNIIYGISGDMTPDTEIQQEDYGATLLPYVSVDTYSKSSSDLMKLFLKEDGEINEDLTVGVAFQPSQAGEDGTYMRKGISVEWENLDELISVLKSPLGSKDAYNTASYTGNFIQLKGKIASRTALEQQVSMAFRVRDKIVRDIDYPNLAREFYLSDAYGIIPVEIASEVKALVTDPDTGVITYEGNNKIDIVLNKPYALKGVYKNDRDEVKMGIVTPSQYIRYLFSEVAIGFEGDIHGIYAMQFELREDFDDILFFKKDASEFYDDPNVAISDDLATVYFTVTKLGIGSCEQSFTVSVTAIRDAILTSTYTDNVETFDRNGVPLYGGIDGYVIPATFTIEYEKSGIVEYQDLEWYALEASFSYNNERVIEIGDRVSNVPYEFFRFIDGSYVSLTTTLQDGTEVTRRINFRKKNINRVHYKTEGMGIYNINDGWLHVKNVYEFYPVQGLETRLSTVIVPSVTTVFQAEYKQEFTLDDIGWIPAEGFSKDDDPTQFDPQKLVENITYMGLNGVLFATSTVTGYNGEKQIIELRIKVDPLSNGGTVYNNKINLTGTNAVIDPYDRPENENGILVLPKDLTVRFGAFSPDQAVYTFAQNSNISFAIKNVVANAFEPITQITYDKFGHTLGQEYGGQNAPLEIKVILPDGNDSLTFNIEFLNRELESVWYESRALNTGSGSYETFDVQGKYYIDPYDSSTFALPTVADFKFKIYDEKVNLDVALTPADSSYPFINTNGVWKLDINEEIHSGGTYLFYGKLRGIGDGDADQYYVLAVVILDRSITTLPSALTENDKVFTFSGKNGYPNPFEGLVSDIPSSLVDCIFCSQNLTNGSVVSALDELKNTIYTLPGSTGAKISHYDFSSNNADILCAEYSSGGTRTPVIPNIKWYKDGVLLTNDDILVRGGFTYDLVGCVGYGEDEERTTGEQVSLQIKADLWDFVSILGINNYVIEFNRYSAFSIEDHFNVKFVAGPAGEQVEQDPVTFYPLDSRIGYNQDKLRKVIDWMGVDPDLNTVSSVVLRNTFKSAEVNRITTEPIYNLDYLQIAVEEISFGFGEDDGYNHTGSVYLIIDPLNPVFPTTALARGKNPHNQDEIINIGLVNIEWINKDTKSASSIYNIKMGGGVIDQVDLLITDSTHQSTPFVAKVYYLNRIVKKIYTTTPGYSSLAAYDGKYLLMERAEAVGAAIPSTKTYHALMDPTNPNLFVADSSITTNLRYRDTATTTAQSLYKMPSNLELEFYGRAVNTGMTNAIYNEAIDKLGSSIKMKNISWLFSRDVALEPATQTDPIVSNIRGYVAEVHTSEGIVSSEFLKVVRLNPDGEHSYVHNELWIGDYLDLNVRTTDRRVTHTSVSNEVEGYKDGKTVWYQKAYEEWYIDPYNIKFPKIVDVTFKGQAQSERYGSESSPINWEYDTNYLNRSDVISGRIGPSFMVLTASFKAYGAKVSIQFSIRARDIETSVTLPNGQQTTEPINGGTIYVLKGKDLKPQLPTKLYYRFDYMGNSEIASAPLTFSDNALAGINTSVAVSDPGQGGMYTNVAGTLGTIDDENILFNIVVIDPKLYSIQLVDSEVETPTGTTTVTTYKRGNFILDQIAVSVSRSNVYALGPEDTLLPKRVIITDDGDYIDVEKVEYDIPAMKAYVECSYSFLSFADNPRLFGSDTTVEEDSKKLTIVFEVNLTKYVYISIEVGVAEFNVPSYVVPLGKVIMASELPKLRNGVAPLWVLDDVNTNKAGIYQARCYFKNAYGAIVEGTLPIVVQKKQIRPSDITISRQFLDRTYTGRTLEFKDYVTFADFLREDGTFGQLEGYTLQYSIDGGATWMRTQPTNVPEEGSLGYRLKILVDNDDDYNIYGECVFRLNISRAEVERDKVYFHVGGNRIQTGNYAEFEYNGNSQSPEVYGIPEGVSYNTLCAKYIPNQAPNYTENTRPIDAGEYIITIRFNEDQRNYKIEEGTTFSVLVRINRKNVSYQINTSFQYTGLGFNVPIIGLPYDDEGTLPADIKVTYKYYDQTEGSYLPAGSTLLNAGQYTVSIKVNGGINYPSVNLEPGDDNYANSTANLSLKDNTITIHRKKVIFNVGEISSDYLEELKGLNSALTVLSAITEGEDGHPLVTPQVEVNANGAPISGLQGNDKIEQFGNIIVSWFDAQGARQLTRKHMVGSYPLRIENLGSISHGNYEIVGEIQGLYRITATQPNTVVIDDKEDLDDALSLIRDGDTKRLHLRSGHYGEITLTKNAAVSIVGSYNVSEEDDEIVVTFDKITVERGALLLDIVKMNAKANTGIITVKENVSSVTLRRSEFIDSSFTHQGGSSTTENSSVVRTAPGFKGIVYVDDTIIVGFSAGLQLTGGSVDIANSKIHHSIIGISVMSGNAMVSNTEFRHCKNIALKLSYKKGTASIFDNIFWANYTAIQSVIALRNDITIQNTFGENARNIERLQ